jgi:hypothetical protein
MFSSLVACKEENAHLTFLKVGVNSAPFRIALTLPYKVANFLSILPFYCGESGAVNSNFAPHLRRSLSKIILDVSILSRIVTKNVFNLNFRFIL